VRLKTTRGFFILATIAVLALSLLIALPGLNGDELEAAEGAKDWTLLGLDARDYAEDMAAKVSLADRQWIRHHKIVVYWNRIQPEKDVWRWRYYDEEINTRLADGSDSILLLLHGGTPTWCQDASYGEFANKAPPTNLGYWYDFCAAVAERYGDVVDFYEIWNEPGWDRDSEAIAIFGSELYHFGGQVETDYLPILQLANAAIKEKDPTGQVMCGALINTLNPDPNTGNELYMQLFDEVNRPGQNVSVQVEAGQPIVAERPMYFNYSGAWAGGHDVLGANAPSNQWYFAEGTTRNGFDEWLCMQNPNNNSITVNATYMFGPGQGDNMVMSYNLPPNSRTTLKVNDQVGPEKDVSLALTSSGDFIAERPMYFNYNGMWAGGHNVLGANAASNQWYFAEGTTRNGFDEWLCLQNPNASSINVNATFMFGPGQGDNQVMGFNLPPNSRTTLKVNDLVGPEKDVSVELTSGSDFIAERPMYFNYNGMWAGGHDVLGANQSGKEWYFAEGTTRNGFDEWLCLQNPNANSINVNATFMFGPGQGDNQVMGFNLPPNSRTTLKVNDLVGPEKDVSVELTSGSDFIAERPMYFNYNGVWAGGHDVLGANGASNTWYFAEGCTGFSIQEYLCLQNPHSEAVPVDLTFMMTRGEVLQKRVTLPPDSRTTLDINMFIGFHGSCDMVAVHPYKNYWDWGEHYSYLVQSLQARNVWQELAVTECGWPHTSDNGDPAFSEAKQAEAIGAVGIGDLFNNGCKKIWVYRGIDEDPGTSWDNVYYGLFNYQGIPHPAWSMYVQWQQQLPDYPNLPAAPLP
jgi:hypothetical protein